MQPQEFLKELFKILGISENNWEQLKKDFGEIVANNISAALISELPVDKRASFKALLKGGNVDQGSLQKWVKDQRIFQDSELIKKLNTVAGKSLDDFFAALTVGLEGKKREEVAAFARRYLQ